VVRKRRKLAAGKTTMEAMRCLKPRLSDIVYQQMRADPQEDKRGRHAHSELANCPSGSGDLTVALRRSESIS
jgi:hypothetical protein